MENLEIYNKVRQVPTNAKKDITAGRLKGMTDINPQWRIEKLTEMFGPVGSGWFAREIKREFIDGANDEKVCFVDIELFVKVNGEWSKPIYGTGGSTFVAKESKGLYTSDEVVKMAYTDAISVACKQLGFGADIYWNKSDSKYQQHSNTQQVVKQANKPVEMIEGGQITAIRILLKDREELKKAVYKKLGITSSTEMPNKLTKAQGTSLIKQLKAKVGE